MTVIHEIRAQKSDADDIMLIGELYFSNNERVKKDEDLKIPIEIDYDKISGLTEEVKNKLRIVKPETFGQALRIDGMTPAAINLLLAHTKRYKFKHSA